MGLTPQLLDLITRFENAIVLEVGVAQAESAVKILNLPNVSKYIGVDPWLRYDNTPDNRYKEGYLDRKMGLWDNQDQWDKIYHLAQEKLKPYGTRAQLIKGFSHEARDLVREELDVVSIDGNHQYEYALEDIRIWYPKLKKGGVMLVDDYSFKGGPIIDDKWGGRKASEVDKAVNDFCNHENIEFSVIDNNAVIYK